MSFVFGVSYFYRKKRWDKLEQLIIQIMLAKFFRCWLGCNSTDLKGFLLNSTLYTTLYTLLHYIDFLKVTVFFLTFFSVYLQSLFEGTLNSRDSLNVSPSISKDLLSFFIKNSRWYLSLVMSPNN